MNNDKISIIAFYLPQFHPIAENDKWWGKGFTEWTNVAKAKPLFKGHYQPRIPADLGFYDLRLNEIMENQVEFAKEAGITAFCFWHYWFGNGKRLLEKPVQMYVENKDIEFPFCLAWANHSWQKKSWNPEISRLSKELLIEQEYPSKKDIDDHFYEMLPMFKDKRYYRIKDKLVFILYRTEDIPDSKYFIERWNELAILNNIPNFYFIGHTSEEENLESDVYKNLDAINLHILHKAFKNNKIKRYLSWIFKRPLNTSEYKDSIRLFESKKMEKDNIYPTLYPNWDASPRLGNIATILNNSTPMLFKIHVKRILDLIKHKKEEDKIIFLKSWNEWAEGNYMEPDLKFGKSYIKVLSECLAES